MSAIFLCEILITGAFHGRAGAHLELQIPGVGTRIYSLCGNPSDERRWQIAIKRATRSRGGSNWLHDNLNKGDIIYTTFPRAGFKIAESAQRHIMVAGGIGVTPFLAMAHSLEAQGKDWHLHIVNRGQILPLEIAALMGTNRVVFHDTNKVARPPISTLVGSANLDTAAYCCGPTDMVESFQTYTADWPTGLAQIEYFLPPKIEPVADAMPYRVTLAKSGISGNVTADETLLQALRRLGKKVDSSCEGGICGVCEVAWLEGSPVHRDLILSPERRNTHLLACVSGCSSDKLVLDL